MNVSKYSVKHTNIYWILFIQYHVIPLDRQRIQFIIFWFLRFLSVAFSVSWICTKLSLFWDEVICPKQSQFALNLQKFERVKTSLVLKSIRIKRLALAVCNIIIEYTGHFSQPWRALQCFTCRTVSVLKLTTRLNLHWQVTCQRELCSSRLVIAQQPYNSIWLYYLLF